MRLSVQRKISRSEEKAIPPLLKSHPPLLVRSGILSFEEYARYLCNNIRHSLAQSKRSCLVVAGKNNISGVALLRFMEWDSLFFQIPIGSIEHVLSSNKISAIESHNLEKELLINCVNLAKDSGIKILYSSAYSTKYPLIATLNALRFHFLCGELEGLNDKGGFPGLCKQNNLPRGYKFRRYKKGDYSQVIKMAEEITKDVESKFSLTPHLDRVKKKNYYVENIKNCCRGMNADDMFVALKNRLIGGFACYRQDRRLEESLGRKLSFLVILGILRSERRKNIGASFVTWSHQQVLKNSEILSAKVYLHNLPMLGFILKRRLTHSFDILYTFCKKL